MNKTLPVKVNRPLHWFAVLTAVATFLLLGAGGLVTSHEAGMSVPDWSRNEALSLQRQLEAEIAEANSALHY